MDPSENVTEQFYGETHKVMGGALLGFNEDEYEFTPEEAQAYRKTLSDIRKLVRYNPEDWERVVA